MKCSLLGAIIQKDGLFYKGLETIYFSIFLGMENGLFAKKNSWYMLLAISANG